MDRRADPLDRHGAELLQERVKWHLLARMIPLVENNYNFCELGPRGTGKSHIYKEISPNSILVSGGDDRRQPLLQHECAQGGPAWACGIRSPSMGWLASTSRTTTACRS